MRILIDERWCGGREREGREEGREEAQHLSGLASKNVLVLFWFCSFSAWPNLFQEVVYS